MHIQKATSFIRRGVENSAGALGGLAGSALYSVPGALAGASYGRDRYEGARWAGPETVSNLIVPGMLTGVATGATVGALSYGLTGALVGAGLGFVGGGVAGFGVLLGQHCIVGREHLDQRLGRVVREEVDKNFTSSVYTVPYSTHDKVAGSIKGLRGGMVAGLKEGFTLGKAEAAGAVSGLIDGAAGLPQALTFRRESDSDRSLTKKLLGVPLGVANGLLGAAVTAPAGALQGLGPADEGQGVAITWGAFTALAAGAAGAVIGQSLEAAGGGALLGLVGSIIVNMGDYGWKRPAQVAERMAQNIHQATLGRDGSSSDPAYRGFHDTVQGVVVGTAAGINAGFEAGYEAANKLTDGICDLTSRTASGLVSSFKKVPEVLTGVKDGLK